MMYSDSSTGWGKKKQEHTNSHVWKNTWRIVILLASWSYITSVYYVTIYILRQTYTVVCEQAVETMTHKQTDMLGRNLGNPPYDTLVLMLYVHMYIMYIIRTHVNMYVYLCCA